MAQLTDDCFAFDGPLIRADDALARIRERLVPIADSVCVPVSSALGRILAEDVIAPHSIPPYANSAVDGFAVFHADLNPNADTHLPVGGRVAAGSPLGRPQSRGEAVKIFTGAPIPDGADGGPPDTVMMLEDCVEPDNGCIVTVHPGIRKGANLRPAGDDVSAGSTVLSAGTKLRPQELGMLAACGRTEVSVYRPLSVAIFSTGDEIRDPGTPLEPGTQYDSNRRMIAAALECAGFAVTDFGIIPDDADAISGTLASAAADHSAVVTTGGMSMGEEDHVRAAIECSGQLSFWRVAIKPGRPVGMGLISRGDSRKSVLIGLPGNPVAALTTLILLGRPTLLTLQGARDIAPKRYRAVLGFDYKKKPDRREFVRVVLDGRDAETGMPIARKHGKSGAGVLSSLVGADGFVEIAEDDTHLVEGSVVDFLPFSEVF